jgi:putative NADPH-quinone reductase
LRAALEAAGAEVRVHDLLPDGFDPVLRLADGQPHAVAVSAEEDPVCARYQEDVRWATDLAIVHPVWWFAPPAVLKGWVDRVLVEGVALRQQPVGPPRGLLTGRRLLVVQTFQTHRALARVAFGGVAGSFWRRVVGLPTGMERVTVLPLFGVLDLAPTRLARYERRLERAAHALVARP